MEPLPNPIPAPLDRYRGRVLPEWVDYNGHMNVAYYVLAFDHATDVMFDFLGFDEAYRNRTGCSLFMLEQHVTYVEEVKLGDPLRITTDVLGYDAKRLHNFHRMYHAEKGYLAATTELMGLHVDLNARRGCPFPPELLKRVEAVAAAHAGLPRAPELGRGIALRSSRPKAAQ